MPTIAPDGNIVAEFLFIEKLWKNASLTNNYQDYVCTVNINPMYECIDVASPKTLALSNLINTDTGEVGEFGLSVFNPSDDITSVLSVNESHLFGVDQCGNGANTGDGIVNAFDLAVYMWYTFNTFPYNLLSRDPSVVQTTDARSHTASRCGLDTSRSEWVVATFENDCISGDSYTGRRSLQDELVSYESLDVSVTLWTELADGSKWFKMSPNRLLTVFNFFIEGLAGGRDHFGVLSNDFRPDFGCTNCIPNDALNLEVRFERQDETDSSCSIISGGFTSTEVLHGFTMSMRQDPVSTACQFDIFLYVPYGSLISELHHPCVGRGSVASGYYAYIVSEACDFSLNGSLSGGGVSIDDDDISVLAGSSSGSSGLSNGQIGGIVGGVLGFALLCCCCLAYFLYEREESHN